MIDAAGSAARGAYTLDAFPREDRVRSMAYQRSALNIGFTVGAGVGGVVLAVTPMTLFLAGSVMCGLAWTMGLLIAFPQMSLWLPSLMG